MRRSSPLAIPGNPPDPPAWRRRRDALRRARLTLAVLSACTVASIGPHVGAARGDEPARSMPTTRSAPTTRPVHSHQQVITADRATYAVRVGGTLDEFNTRVMGSAWNSAFQPNLAVRVSNTGDVVVRNPRVRVGDRGDWFSMDDIVSRFVRPGMSDEEKVFALWNWCREHIGEGPSYNEALWGEPRSVVRFLNGFGTGACGTYHIVMPLIGTAAGVESYSGNVANGSHAVQMQAYGGRERFLDCMLRHGDDRQPRGYFALALDNATVVGPKELAADPYLLARTGTTPGFFGVVSYFGGPGMGFWKEKRGWHDPHRMELVLRPGESIENRWTFEPPGWLGGGEVGVGSGEIVFRPRLSERDVRRDAATTENMHAAGHAVWPSDPSKPARLAYEMRSPYVLTGASIAMCVRGGDGQAGDRARRDRDDRVHVRMRVGDREIPSERVRGPATAPTSAPANSHAGAATRTPPNAAGRDTLRFAAGDVAEFRRPHFTHRVTFIVSIDPGADAVRVDDLELRVGYQVYLPSLPSLRAGDNTVEYRDETREPHEVVVEHMWCESSDERPPGPPVGPVEPADGTNAPFTVTFKWHPPESAKATPISAWRFQLSARPDMAWPLLPAFDQVIEAATPSLAMPVPDAFLPGHTYYWHVRGRTTGGTWGAWSPVWRFVARGPGLIRNARIETDGASGRVRLRWDAPADGEPVARYAVFASRELGFTPTRVAFSQSASGFTRTCPPTWIADVTACDFDVTDRVEPFYRVVAVDAAGSPSAPTPCLERAHPAIGPTPPPPATRGRPYQFDVPVVRSDGLYVWTLAKGIVAHRADDVQFALRDAPAWLSIDPKTATVRGDVPADATSTAFTVEMTIAGAAGPVRRHYDVPVR